MIVEYDDLYDDLDVRYKAKESDQWKTVGIDELILNYEDARWIPVTERLPIEFLDRRILVSTVSPTGRKSVDIGLWEGGKWTTYFPIGDDKVTAWQPLPEPYAHDEC